MIKLKESDYYTAKYVQGPCSYIKNKRVYIQTCIYASCEATREPKYLFFEKSRNTFFLDISKNQHFRRYVALKSYVQIFLPNAISGDRSRTILPADRLSLTRSLQEERRIINQREYGNSALAPCYLTNGVIKSLLYYSKSIFCLEDVKLLVSDEETATRVLQVFKEEFEDF